MEKLIEHAIEQLLVMTPILIPAVGLLHSLVTMQ